MDLEDRQRICRLVAGVMFSDGHFAEEERAFLERICVRFGLARDAYEELTPLDTGACSAALRELPEKVQAKVLALLVEASASHKTIAPSGVSATSRCSSTSSGGRWNSSRPSDPQTRTPSAPMLAARPVADQDAATTGAPCRQRREPKRAAAPGGKGASTTTGDSGDDSAAGTSLGAAAGVDTAADVGGGPQPAASASTSERRWLCGLGMAFLIPCDSGAFDQARLEAAQHGEGEDIDERGDEEEGREAGLGGEEGGHGGGDDREEGVHREGPGDEGGPAGA